MNKWSLMGWLVLAGCATSGTPQERLSLEFGQDAYLDARYLAETRESVCGPPAYAPGGKEVRAPLPDGSWFRLVAVPSDGAEVSTVVLQRGWVGEEAVMEMRLDGEEGIVRLVDRGERDAWGIHHRWADWMRSVGARALSLECPSAGSD